MEIPPALESGVDGAGSDGKWGDPRMAGCPMLFQIRFGCGSPPVTGVGKHIAPTPFGCGVTVDAFGSPTHPYIAKGAGVGPRGGASIVMTIGDPIVVTTTRSASPSLPLMRRTTGGNGPVETPRVPERQVEESGTKSLVTKASSVPPL